MAGTSGAIAAWSSVGISGGRKFRQRHKRPDNLLDDIRRSIGGLAAWIPLGCKPCQHAGADVTCHAGAARKLAGLMRRPGWKDRS